VIEINRKQVEELANGTPPWEVNDNWDAEMVIVQLARDWLRHADLNLQIADYIIEQEEMETK
jgi:hypothetical protein